MTKKTIIGDIRTITTVNCRITQRLLDEDNMHHLVIYADRVILKEDLYFPAKNIFIHARIVELADNCTICTQVSEADLERKAFPWGSPKLVPSSEFFDEAFKNEGKTAENLHKALMNRFSKLLKLPEKITDNIVRLNKFLELTGLYTEAKNYLKKSTTALEALVKETDGYRNKNYQDLSSEQQKKIQKLNREIIELLHPLETPERLMIWLDYKDTDCGLKGEDGISGDPFKQNGEDGKLGWDGRHGSDGIDGGDIVILAEALDFKGYKLILNTSGSRGGRAENGGQGGKGGKAAESKAKVVQECSFMSTTLTIDGKSMGNVFGGWNNPMSSTGHDAIKNKLNKPGKGGEGGKAGQSGNGGNAGSIYIGCVRDVDTSAIAPIRQGGAGGPDANGGKGGESADPSELTMKVKALSTGSYDFGGSGLMMKEWNETYKGDPGPIGAQGKNNAHAVAGLDGRLLVEKVDYRMLMTGPDGQMRTSDQRLMTFRALKSYYLKGGAFLEIARDMIIWLLNVTPDTSFIREIESRLTMEQRLELSVLAALRSNVQVISGYMASGVDFYGHSWNYVPVISFDHYRTRINDMLRVGKLVEDEHRAWSGERKRREDMADDLNKSIQKINAGTDKIANGFSQLLSERNSIEQQLDSYRLELDAEAANIRGSHKAFMEAVDTKLKIAFGLGCLNMLAQIVLISTGNVGYGKYLKYAGTALDKVKGFAGLDAGFTDPIKKSFENSSEAMQSLDKYKKDKKAEQKKVQEVEAKIIADGDKQRIEIEINKKKQPAEPEEPSALQGAFSKGVDVVQNVLPILGTANELWTIGKKFGEVQDKFGFDSIKLAMDNGSYESLIDQFAQYADTEAKTFKAAIGNFMELSKKRNELLLNYRALQGKCAELYAKNALINAQLALCRERMAWTEDPAVAGMDQFWGGLYDFMRDRILDRIYDEYKAYCFYSLTDQPFSETSIDNVLRDQTATKKVANDADSRDVGSMVEELELSQNITSLSVLQDTVADKMFAAEEGQFSSWKSFKSEAGRVSFKREQNEATFAKLEKTGKAMFYISPESTPFRKLSNVYITSIEAFFLRKQSLLNVAPVKVSLQLQHAGSVEIKDRSGKVLRFLHNEPGIFSYEYGSFFDVVGLGKKPRFSKTDERLTDVSGKEVFYEISANEIALDNKYIRVNPCTWWTIEIDNDHTQGLELDNVTELVLQFSGRGIVIGPMKASVKKPVNDEDDELFTVTPQLAKALATGNRKTTDGKKDKPVKTKKAKAAKSVAISKTAGAAIKTKSLKKK